LKEEYKQVLEKHVKQLSELQAGFSMGPTSMRCCVVFQGMDAAGKDGAIRHVMPG